MRFPALPAQAVQYGRGDERIEFVEAVEGQHRDLHVKTPAKNDGPKGPRLYRAFEDIINPARPRGVSRKRSAQRDRQMRDRHDVLQSIAKFLARHLALHFDDRRARLWADAPDGESSEEHTSELQSIMRIATAVFCL